MTEREFRATLGRFATGVALVTTSDAGGRPLGLIVSSFASVSLEPPLVCFCPSRDSHTWRRMRGRPRFGVNLLAERHAEYVRRAAAPGAERFAGMPHHVSATGVPVLDEAVGHLECAIEDEYAAGDHWIVVGRVHALHAHPARRPLVHFAGRLGALAA